MACYLLCITSQNAPPKTADPKKTCPEANQSIELSFAADSFARAFVHTSCTTIKYVSCTGSSISWSGVARSRFAFSKNAGRLEKACPRANQPMQSVFALHFFTRVSVRLPCTTIKYDIHRASNRRAGFRVLVSIRKTRFQLTFCTFGTKNGG